MLYEQSDRVVEVRKKCQRGVVFCGHRAVAALGVVVAAVAGDSCGVAASGVVVALVVGCSNSVVWIVVVVAGAVVVGW